VRLTKVLGGSSWLWFRAAFMLIQIRFASEADLEDVAYEVNTLVHSEVVCQRATRTNFNGEHYLQISGTSMGTNVAPSYAILFMDKLECKALDQYHLKPTFYGRYIDDIFICWQYGVEELNKFLDYMNSQHESIQFTLEHSPKQVNFLDTTVVIDDLHKKL
jgi:hypothetical protein